MRPLRLVRNESYNTNFSMIKLIIISAIFFLVVWQQVMMTTNTHQIEAANAKIRSLQLKLVEAQQALREEQTNSQHLDLKNAPAGDRTLDGTNVDLYYDLQVSKSTQANLLQDLTYEKCMTAIHGTNIWDDERLNTILDLWGIRKGQGGGSPIADQALLYQELEKRKPRVFMEIGVFRGDTSIAVAKMMDKLSQEHHEMKDSIVISVDSWLLDLSLAWKPEEKARHRNYFEGLKVGGHEMMYFVFLANVLKAKMNHRIIPLPSASLNAVLALLQHGIRADVLYLDASHANPDVFLDLIGFWNVLNKGGLLIADDYNIVQALRVSVDRFLQRYADEIEGHKNNRGQYWIYKKG